MDWQDLFVLEARQKYHNRPIYLLEALGDECWHKHLSSLEPLELNFPIEHDGVESSETESSEECLFEGHWSVIEFNWVGSSVAIVIFDHADVDWVEEVGIVEKLDDVVMRGETNPARPVSHHARPKPIIMFVRFVEVPIVLALESEEAH